ncbi:BRO family protein [Lactococcus laudensis]|uniref:BRO family protein n=1 Tax=Pseudolactococcus laudensis TaxID=1494461 RepID=UPI002FC73841
MNELQNFNFSGQDVRIITINDEPWFVVADIAKVLGASNSRSLAQMVDEEDKGKQSLRSGSDATIVNESGLYTILLRSNNPQAKPLRRWVTSEVLPTIRKHGAYMTQPQVPTTQRELIMLALAGNEETNQRIDAIEEQVTDLKENATLNPGEYGYIGRRINQRVSEVAKGYGNITQEQRGKLYKDINQGVKAITGVSTRTQLRTKHYEVVLEFINDWEPSTATKMQVRQTSFEF